MADIFFAILPDSETRPRITGLTRQLGLRGSAVPPGRLHVSNHWVGDHTTPAAAIEAAKRAAAAVDMPCFRIAFDRVQSFNGQKQVPIVLAGGDELVGLLMLREMLVARLDHRAKPGFTPHLTFLYSGRAGVLDRARDRAGPEPLGRGQPPPACALSAAQRRYRLIRFRSWRMIGRAGMRRTMVLNPRRLKVEAKPVLVELGESARSKG